MHKVWNIEVALGEHSGDVLQVHLDGVDLVGVLRIVRRYLYDPAVWREDEMMRGGCLAESHSGMRRTALNHASVVVVALREHGRRQKQYR